ncbi:MAG: hypothetical protein IPN22_04085 [Bacteroidetes bacterium]|nr:hypothetical protein [Bacteroidota bacterium]
MINPIRLTNNIFADPRLSDANLRAFSEDHLIRLANNNPGAIYSSLISDTTSAYNAYYGKMSSEAIQTQIKEGLTLTKNQSRTLAEAKVSQLQGLIKFKWGETSAIYQEFYPQGMDAFYRAKDADLEVLLDAYQASAVTHLTADFPSEVASLTTLVTAYKNAYSAQRNALSQIDNLITGKNEDRQLLTVQLTKNFLIIASNNIENTDAFDDYYDPRYLPLTEGPEFFSGLINAKATITAIGPGTITRSSNLDLENNGMVSLLFSINDNPTLNPVTQLELGPGQRIRYTEPMPAFAQYFLLIQNNESDLNGSWKVEVS